MLLAISFSESFCFLVKGGTKEVGGSDLFVVITYVSFAKFDFPLRKNSGQETGRIQFQRSLSSSSPHPDFSHQLSLRLKIGIRHFPCIKD